MHQLPCIKLTNREDDILSDCSLHSMSYTAAILARDAEAERVHQGLSKRRRAEERAWFKANERNMARGDRESKVFQQIDAMHEELKRYREEKAGRAIPEPKFKTGQSVLQWWSKSAAETPLTYHKKTRPAWFSAEICSYNKYGTIRYAGQLTTSNLYNVY